MKCNNILGTWAGALVVAVAVLFIFTRVTLPFPASRIIIFIENKRISVINDKGAP